MMTIDSIEPPKPFELYKVAFEFEDRRGVFKNRPVVVISPRQFSDRVLVLSIKVTSKEPRAQTPGEVVLLDWEKAGLTKPSVARCSKLAQIPVSKFTNESRYGRLSSRDSRRVFDALVKLGILASLDY